MTLIKTLIKSIKVALSFNKGMDKVASIDLPDYKDFFLKSTVPEINSNMPISIPLDVTEKKSDTIKRIADAIEILLIDEIPINQYVDVRAYNLYLEYTSSQTRPYRLGERIAY